MISHWLGPIRYADRIIVLQDGKIAEQGNHTELLELNKIYAQMYKAQAEWYKK